MTHSRRQQPYELPFGVGYGKAALQLSPAIIVFAMAHAIASLKDVDPVVKIYFVLGGFLITALWMILDRHKDKSDFTVNTDVQNQIEAIDRDMQEAIYDSLHDLRIIDDTCTDASDEEKIVRCTINNLIFRGLISSIFQNHYGKEIADAGNNYVEKKKKRIYRLFSGSNAGYKQLLTSRLPAGVTFEQAVDSVVSHWVLDHIIPAVLNACEEKINYYIDLIKRGDLSTTFKAKTQERIDKNRRYIAAAQELQQSSLSMRSRVLSSAVIAPFDLVKNKDT